MAAAVEASGKRMEGPGVAGVMLAALGRSRVGRRGRGEMEGARGVKGVSARMGLGKMARMTMRTMSRRYRQEIKANGVRVAGGVEVVMRGVREVCRQLQRRRQQLEGLLQRCWWRGRPVGAVEGGGVGVGWGLQDMPAATWRRIAKLCEQSCSEMVDLLGR
jgi:hypothetical protein